MFRVFPMFRMFPMFRVFPKFPIFPMCSLCEAHLTFEAKLRNASTLLRLGKTKKSCFALTLIAKFTFHFSLFTFFRIFAWIKRAYV